MLHKLYDVSNGKYLKVNIDKNSVSPTYYCAGGFKQINKDASSNSTI